MNISTYKGKTLSFFELIKEHRIEIPIIQRDYAQGRVDKKEIRLNFLNALLDCIQENKPIQLDFIYGSNINSSFQPLDGQQRLTTLFLLYWYAAVKSKTDAEYAKLLTKFSYETRITSRDFCHALINNPFEISSISDFISSKIIDSNWFFLSWKKDPTIDAMLRTIDDIHCIFYKIENLWEKLTINNNLITFYYVELENIGLTDDLYIKMNARGKLLTPFENFKASFQKHIKEQEWERNKPQFTDCFAFKIDTNWTDLFWSNFRKVNNIDDSLMRFIATIAMIRQAIDRTTQKAEERISLISLLQDNPNSVRPYNFTQISFDYLVDCFNVYEKVINLKTNLELNMPLWRHKPKNSLLAEIVFEENVYSFQVNSATYSLKILFFAQTEYLKRIQNFNAESFQDWMRVVRNIISKGDIDKDGNRPDIVRSPPTFDGAVNLIYELAEGCGDIYSYLNKLNSLKSYFAKEQIEEEKKKAKLISSKHTLKQIIFSAEDIELLRGRIDFIFYCMDYDGNPDNFNEDLFIRIQNIFTTYFNKETDISNDLRRAFLTIDVDGKFEFYTYWWSFWNVVSANKRRLFDKFRELEYYMYSEHKIYFKKLILLLLDNELKQIALNFNPPSDMPNWKVRLIKEPELLDKKSKSNYIAIPEDNSCCYLLKSKRPRDTDGCIRIN